jgi:hypothetical protein
MPSLFANLERVAGATIDRVMADGFVFTPRQKAGGDVNGRASDAGPSFPVTGIFVCDGKLIHAEGRGQSDEDAPSMMAAPAFIDAFASAFPSRPEQGWHVQRTDTGERFRVADVKDIEGGRLYIALTRQK